MNHPYIQHEIDQTEFQKLKQENEQLKKQQGQLQRVKEICNRMCGSCRFNNTYSCGCLFKSVPDNWDIEFILEKLDGKNN